MTSDDDRIAYLGGEGAGSLDDGERAELDELRALLADPALWATPAPDLEDAVVAAIAAEAAVPRPSRTDARPSRADTKRRWLRPGPFLAAAAAAAVIVVAALAIGGGSGTEQEQLAATLTPTELVPQAYGSATLTRTDAGWRIELDTSGLPPLEDGRFYQAWLRSESDVLVPLGTFDAGGEVVLWAGVSPRDFPTLSITEETADGDQSSSGRRVLVGPVTEA